MKKPGRLYSYPTKYLGQIIIDVAKSTGLPEKQVGYIISKFLYSLMNYLLMGIRIQLTEYFIIYHSIYKNHSPFLKKGAHPNRVQLKIKPILRFKHALINETGKIVSFIKNTIQEDEAIKGRTDNRIREKVRYFEDYKFPKEDPDKVVEKRPKYWLKNKTVENIAPDSGME